jgi:hypothetical protein
MTMVRRGHPTSVILRCGVFVLWPSCSPANLSLD